MVAAYRFAADLKSKSDLRSQAEKNQAERRDSAPMARVVAFANQRGYSFTIDEAKECATESHKANFAGEDEPTDVQLNRATGVYLLTDGYFIWLGSVR